MKKRISLLLVTACLLICALGAFPTQAASAEFTVLHYTLDPLEEGGESETGRLVNGMTLPRTPTITYDSTITELLVNGEICAEDSVRLEVAGLYELTVVDKSDPETSAIYSITVLPELNISNEQEFTSYPTIVCENAAKMILDKGKFGAEVEIESGYEVTSLGIHTLQVLGRKPDGSSMFFSPYTFYIKVCSSERVYDEESGKQALKITVGEFEGLSVEATLDGAPLEPGSHIVTEVGHRSVAAKINSTEVTNLHMLPSIEQLTLRVQLRIDSFESDEPIYLDLEQWDANFLLNGKEVKENIRITKSGSHTLTVVDKEGNAMTDIFSVLVGDAEAYESMDSLTFHFANPHHTYVIFVLVPIALILVIALIFLLNRRRIV